MRRIKLTLSYDGTNYVGWQVQPNGLSIQALLQDALKEMTGIPTNAIAAGRTDAGVHAIGQVAHFSTDSDISVHGFKGGLNSILPRDIVITTAEEAGPDFHAMRDANGKRYMYEIALCEERVPILANRCWQLFENLEIEAMRRAASILLGKHDFESFRASGCTSPHAVRTISKLEISSEPMSDVFTSGKLNYLKFTVEGNSFVRHMVRNIVGTLVGVGRRRMTPDDVSDILNARDRKKAGVCAPACGLYLVRVFY